MTSKTKQDVIPALERESRGIKEYLSKDWIPASAGMTKGQEKLFIK